MDETKVQIGEDVLLDIGIHSDWYISSIGYDGESVDVALRRKADRNKEWWLADTPQTERKCIDCKYLTYMYGKTWCNIKCDNPHDKVCDRFKPKDEQTDCPWK